ncbi:MAG: ABC transporter permease [Anaerolineaceae bacterium]|nr:ABC transporter permease [Anaerolineaceae bacterium]
MFWNMMKYEIRRNFRTKEVIIWMILFPVVLGTLYKFTMGNLGKNNLYSTVPAAVVENEKDQLFHWIMDAMNNGTFSEENDPTNGGEKPLMNLTYTDEANAIEMLKNGDVKGIIYIDPPDEKAKADPQNQKMAEIMEMINQMAADGTLTKYLDPESNNYVSYFLNDVTGDFITNTKLSVMFKNNGSDQSMIKRMSDMYMNMQEASRQMASNTTMSEDGEGFGDISKAMSSDVPYIKEMELTKGDTDSFLIYMYNLIAMVGIFGSMSGLTIAQNLQANLSDQAARRSCSGMPKIKQVLANLLAYYISHSLCVILTVTFITLVLRVNFGDRLPLVYLGGILGGIMGVSFGYFVGAIGKMSYGAKAGIIMALNMTLCFMSGLMVPGIKAMIIKYIPILNDINPVAIVADSFYYLSVDADLTRFWEKMAVVCIITLFFVLFGFLMTRRTKYASL